MIANIYMWHIRIDDMFVNRFNPEEGKYAECPSPKPQKIKDNFFTGFNIKQG